MLLNLCKKKLTIKSFFLSIETPSSAVSSPINQINLMMIVWWWNIFVIHPFAINYKDQFDQLLSSVCLFSLVIGPKKKFKEKNHAVTPISWQFWSRGDRALSVSCFGRTSLRSSCLEVVGARRTGTREGDTRGERKPLPSRVAFYTQLWLLSLKLLMTGPLISIVVKLMLWFF